MLRLLVDTLCVLFIVVCLFVCVRVLPVMLLFLVGVFGCCWVCFCLFYLRGMPVLVSYVWVLLVRVCYVLVPLHACLVVFVVCELLVIR